MVCWQMWHIPHPRKRHMGHCRFLSASFTRALCDKSSFSQRGLLLQPRPWNKKLHRKDLQLTHNLEENLPSHSPYVSWLRNNFFKVTGILGFFCYMEKLTIRRPEGSSNFLYCRQGERPGFLVSQGKGYNKFWLIFTSFYTQNTFFCCYSRI